jgi:aminobenzoyl-glutamate utilization protein B
MSPLHSARPLATLALLGSVAAAPPPATGEELADLKTAAQASIAEHTDEMVSLADQVWRFAETALRETRSARLLADYAEGQGFRVERGVAGMPTAFIAEYGSGRPIIGIMGEYDALPGISQKAQVTQEPLEAGAAGHGCGHNLFGSASLGAAVAIKELIAAGDLAGTIRFYGTPAEEAVGGKVYMVREGLFDDVDVALAWHPSDEIKADTGSTQALVDFVVEFHGRTAHAAADPWNGRSAVDALELFTFALNQLREHVRPTVRMHYAIQSGGDVPNVVPDYARLWCWMRDSKHESVDRLIERARDMVQGAALAAGVTGELTVQAGDYEMLVNWTGARAIQENLEALGPIPFTEEEQEFARAIQRETGTEPLGLRAEVEPFEENPGEPEGGSTDVADVSWVVPTLHLSVTTGAAEAPWHAWPVVATGGTSIGHKGMVHAAKALAMTMVDLFERPELVAEIRKEFEASTAGKEYKGYIAPGPPPVPADVQ